MTAAKSDTFVGTIGYMPPEQLYGKATPASDLYSLGVTILFLLSGQEPYEFKLKDLRLDYSLHVNMPYSLARLIDRMVEPNIDKRIQRAVEALKIIETGEEAKQKEKKKRKKNILRISKVDLKEADIDVWAEQRIKEQKRIIASKEEKKRAKVESEKYRKMERERKLIEWAGKTPRRVFFLEEAGKNLLKIQKISFSSIIRDVIKQGFFFSLFVSILALPFGIPIYTSIKYELTNDPEDFMDALFISGLILAVINLIYFLFKMFIRERTTYILITDQGRIIMYYRNPKKPFFVGYKEDLAIKIEDKSKGPCSLYPKTKAWSAVTFKTTKYQWDYEGFNQSDANRIRSFMQKHKIRFID
jgi:hypothetical protein